LCDLWKQKGQEGQKRQKRVFVVFALLALFASPADFKNKPSTEENRSASTTLAQ
jgi:hypothetical protein